jgi:hypothetical protein
VKTSLMSKADLFRLAMCYVDDAVHAGMVTAEAVKGLRGALRARNADSVIAICNAASTRYACVEHAAFWRQVPAFFKKNVSLRHPDAEANARTSFMECEEKCRTTNQRLTLSDDALEEAFGLNEVQRRYFFEPKLVRIRELIDELLGPFEPFLDQLPELVRVTSGATATTARRMSQPQRKLGIGESYLAEAPNRAVKYLSIVFSEWGLSSDQVVHSDVPFNRLEFVPKNITTDRSIAAEAKDSLMLQLAFDGFAKRRLRRWGIDLRDQTRNQGLAKWASMTGEYATLDLKSASNLVAKSLGYLFPFSWLRFLDDVRAKYFADPTKGELTPCAYEMLSSMGNGSTFAVETLLFAAVCLASGARVGDFAVYGDDIVVRTDIVSDVVSLLEYLGFEINVEKSFSDPTYRFRESCGVDAFDGIDVTPVFIRAMPKNKPDLCHLINTMAGKVCVHGGRLEEFLLRLVQEHRLPLVPWSEDTRTGVHLTNGDARRLGVLTTKWLRDTSTLAGYQAAAYRGFSPAPKGKMIDLGHENCVYSWGACLYWHIRAQAGPNYTAGEVFGSKRLFWYNQEQLEEFQKLVSLELSAVSTTSKIAAPVRYNRRNILYVVPRTPVPAHLYLWSDVLVNTFSTRA